MKVWRMTYGYKRKDHALALTYLQEATGLSRTALKKELGFLIDMKVLLVTKEQTNKQARKLAFNKNYDEWAVVAMAPRNEVEGNVSDPLEDDFEGNASDPLEGNSGDTQVITLGVTVVTPIKKKDLKKIFKENIECFNDFYLNYPRKISKQAALKAWNKLSKEEDFDPEAVIQQTSNYAKTCELLQTETRYIPHPSTFLNQKRYEDYSTVDPEGLAKGKETKFDSNLDFFKNQLGGGGVEPAASELTFGEGGGSLPEQGTEF